VHRNHENRHHVAAIPLDDPVLQARYIVSMQNKFDSLDHLPDDVDTAWNTFSSIVKDTAQNLVGTDTHQQAVAITWNDRYPRTEISSQGQRGPGGEKATPISFQGEG